MPFYQHRPSVRPKGLESAVTDGRGFPQPTRSGGIMNLTHRESGQRELAMTRRRTTHGSTRNNVVSGSGIKPCRWAIDATRILGDGGR